MATAQASISAVYTAGDISTSFPNYDATCTGPNTILNVQLPSTPGNYEVVSIDISYNFTAHSGGWQNDQQSQVYCQNSGLTESGIYGGSGTDGTTTYERLDVAIANGDYSPGTTLSFEMRAWRTFNAVNSDCSTAENYIVDGTWEITVNYILCPPGGAYLYSQTEVDDFVADYGHCAHLYELLISGNVNDLSGLSNVNSIGNRLMIFETTSLSSLNGLQNIDSIHWLLSIRENVALNNLTGLDGLETAQTIRIEGNNDLQNLIGLGALNNLYNNLEFRDNSNLSSLQGLNSLTISPSFITIENNSALNNLSTLSSLNSTVTNLIIHNNDAIVNLDWLNGTNIGGSISIIGNDGLLDITGMSHLNSHLGNLTISANSSLNSLQGIENLTSINQLIISDMFLPDLAHLNHLTVQESLTLNSISGISDLSGPIDLNPLGNIEIANNPDLLSLSGFLSEIEHITGNLTIVGNNELIDISNLGGFQTISGTFQLSDNTNLSSCCIVDVLYPQVFVNYSIFGNSNNCNSLGDIRISCELADVDGDGIISSLDNCPDNFNPYQQDADGDTVGNACDNCPLMANADQVDANNNFIGDICEIAEPGKVGVNTTDPKTGLEISASELFLSDTRRGLIMTNALGECFRLFVDVEGQLQSREITCPN